MEESKKRPHILVAPNRYDIPFTPQGFGKKEPVPEVANRVRHAASLRAQFAQLAEARTRRPRTDGAASEDDGVRLTVTARTGIGVQTDGLLPASSPVKLLSVRGSGDKQIANLFIPFAAQDEFEKRLTRYGEFVPEDGKAKRVPPNSRFFESARTFRATTLQDLWWGETGDIPAKDVEKDWEVWVEPGHAERIRTLSKRFRLKIALGEQHFPGLCAMRIRASVSSMQQLIEETGAVTELRPCSDLMLDVIEMTPVERKAFLAKLAAKVLPPADDAPRISILDAGINPSNPLIGRALDKKHCYALHGSWNQFGWQPHGNRVAGIALYGSLEKLEGLPGTYKLPARLESVTVLRPPGASNPIDGAIGEIGLAVALLEAEPARRVFCLAASDYAVTTKGEPSTMSGAIDQLAWGGGGGSRLFCVAAGNVLDDPLKVTGYADRNNESDICSPGQALNALTVGGCTFKDKHPHGGSLLSPPGDLSPTSRTSTGWTHGWLQKPDVVAEAGNHEIDADNAGALNELLVLTTCGGNNVATLGETSAATAAVAGMAGRVMAAYPGFWPETVRGLVVHSADWTKAMHRRVRRIAGRREQLSALLSMFGYGVPDETAALESADNALTMVVQDAMRPIRADDSGKVSVGDLRYYPFPWPRNALKSMGSTEVELRVTLSYFVDPDLRAASLENFARYPSHRFSFDLQGADDDAIDVVTRKNKAASKLGLPPRAPPPKRTMAGWLFESTKGNLRNRGTLHHDRWHGPASELARQSGIRIEPRGGWYLDRRDAVLATTDCRFSLIVSIRTPLATQNVYQEVEATISAGRIPTAQALSTLVRTPIRV